ncbi:putative oxidoreductase, Zn-dependent and NAD(P)-binding [uncultured Pleomorphomonas sp.]|uniref:Putative oxidoreductase, Zn-dependent and NAD(P)-binding n=1 Tax=uncultured Pleomorphomonas sp. TaxID=442121 RepID=A0A212LCK3_9HYPH|nr:putative oxidoreductase, Zn-dependent and NAD(P)-binding [uncultured Pleomorphomonas sp.]
MPKDHGGYICFGASVCASTEFRQAGEDEPLKTSGFAATDANMPLQPFSFERREPRANDVAIDILYCGVCHTDLHMTRNDWGGSIYPMVPGHEIVGRVSAIGSAVSRFKVGDPVAVGTIIDSCMQCDQCRRNEEQMCRKGVTLTYNGQDRVTGDITYGGYSSHIVVREEFVLRVPDGLDLARAAPLLCAGITTYSPLRNWNVGPGSRVGVVGLGGLGHLAVKFASALGAHVTVLTRSEGKADTARQLGADDVLLSTSAEQMASAAFAFDVIIDTVPYEHDLGPYLDLLDADGTLVIAGSLVDTPAFSNMRLIGARRRIAGTPSGGIRQTQEMLDFCARKNILPECEMIAIGDIGQAFERLERGDVRYRFVIDMASLPADQAA